MSRLPFTVIPSEGLAYVVIYRRRRYDTHLCGEADRSPTFTRGAVSVLGDKLMRRIHGETL